MKNASLLLALIFCCTLKTSLNAQATFGVKAAVNAAQVNSHITTDIDGIRTDEFDVKLKPQLGFWYHLPLSARFSLQPELLWTQKSLRSKEQTGEVVFDYFSLPVLLNYQFRKFTFELGPEFSFLLDQRFADKNSVLTESPFIKEHVFELAINLGLRYQLNRWLIGLRATHDVTPFDSFEFTEVNGEPVGEVKFFHRGLQLALGYQLF